MGCHALLQGIFLTQGWNPSPLRLLHWQAGSLPVSPPGKPLPCSNLDNHQSILCLYLFYFILFFFSIYFKKQVWLASVSLSFSTLAQQSEGKTVHAQTRLFQSLHTPHPLLMHGILPAKVYLCFPPTHPHSDKCPHHHFISAALLRKSPLEEKKENWMRYHQTQFTSHVGVFTNTTCLEVCKHWRFARKLETRGCTSE